MFRKQSCKTDSAATLGGMERFLYHIYSMHMSKYM
jgi:hypothetical protein